MTKNGQLAWWTVILVLIILTLAKQCFLYVRSQTSAIFKQIQARSIPPLLLMCSHAQLLDGKYQHGWIEIWCLMHWSKYYVTDVCQRM